MARASELGSSDATPVLIIGMPRSGTTLVEQIVSNHPEVGAGGELNFWNERGAAWHQAGAPGTNAGTKATFLGEAAAEYLGVLRAIGPKAARVTDKMPFNLLWAGLIHLVFPRATILHCRRAAIDTALSIHQTHFHPGLAFPTGGAELVAYFRSYRRLTDHWRRVLPADRLIEVDYEDLTRAPEPVIRRIIGGCGLAWDDSCHCPELKETARTFAREDWLPQAAGWDERAEFPIEALRRAAALGFAGIYVGEEFGGSGLGRLDATIIFEELAAACVSTAAYLSIHNMAAWMIDRFGTREQRARLLPDLMSMAHFASYCLTEPGSGSDAAALATRAVRDGADYVLNGTKAFAARPEYPRRATPNF